MGLPDLQGALWAWVQSLPPWQSDLLRRLTTIEDVAADALADATRMVTNAFGLADLPAVAPIPIPALLAPVQPCSTKILAISDFVAVGSVEPGQRLECGADGLTVAFGETGSGKSSYARVLRKACRASAKPVEILPNVLNSGPNVRQTRAGTASIEVSIDGVSTKISRDVNAAPEAGLMEISVFDSDCAAVYADGESEITYTPSSLRLLERLVGFQAQIRKRIDEEVARLDAEQVSLEGFDRNTKAGALVAALTENVNPATVRTLTSVEKEEKKSLEKLRAQLVASKANDPSKMAAQLEKQAKSAEELAAAVRSGNSAAGIPEILRLPGSS